MTAERYEKAAFSVIDVRGKLGYWLNMAHRGRTGISRISLVLASAFLGACSTTSERPVRPVLPPSSGELAFQEAPSLRPSSTEMAYPDAVDLGSKYMISQGHPEAEFRGAERIQPNLWQVHYGLSPSGGLDLYFDGTNKKLIKTEKQEGVSGALVPTGP